MVLDAGRIIEYDSPNDLLGNKKSTFYSMAKDAGLVAWGHKPTPITPTTSYLYTIHTLCQEFPRMKIIWHVIFSYGTWPTIMLYVNTYLAHACKLSYAIEIL